MDASEVDLEVDFPGNDDTAADVRAQVASGLGAALDRGGAGATTARFRVRGNVTGSMYPVIVPCLILFSAFGCPTQIAEADVSLDLQIGEERYTGQGHAKVWGGLYYNNALIPAGPRSAAIGRATAEALEVALRGGPSRP